jgi:hypothetical protein
MPARRITLHAVVTTAIAAAVLGPLAPAGTARLHAQSAQRYGVQVAALFLGLEAGGERVGGFGIEPQFRFNRLYTSESVGAFSLGIGGQYTAHSRGNDELRIAGIFLEPRWVPPIPSRTIFPYLSARLAALRLDGQFVFAPSGVSTGSGYGAGGGVAIRLSRTTNLDAGVQLVRQQFGDIGTLRFRPFTTYAAKIGVSVGITR